MKYKPLLLIVTLLIALQWAVVAPVAACSGNFRQTEPQEHIDDADLVLVGTVTGSTGDIYRGQFTIQVESYLKGSGPDAILITGYGYGGGDCLDRIVIGERWLFLVDGDPASDEVLHASYLQVYDSIQEASPENIAFTSTLTGQAPTPPYPTPLWTMIKYWTYSPVFKVAILAGIPALVLAIGVAIGMRRRRPTKKKNS